MHDEKTYEPNRIPVSDAQSDDDINDLFRKQIIYTGDRESVEISWDTHTEQSF